jgi:hypothetical protein
VTPGTYLRKRREAAGLSLDAVVAALVALPLARTVSPEDRARLAERIAEAEADRDNLIVPQVALLRQVVPLDGEVYNRLLVRHWAGPAAFLTAPQLCRTCGCSWHDPNLCTACEAAARRMGEAA